MISFSFDSDKDIEQSKPLFNSKLFLNLDINQEEISDSSNEKNAKEDFYYLNEFEQINFLSHELIQDLNGSINNDNDLRDDINNNRAKDKDDNITKTNIINSLISLAKDGYEFKPKNYKSEKIKKEQENNSRNANYINNNKFSKNKFNKRRENKNDWICPFCNNLNFSFRKICNKCGVTKISPDSHINNELCVL